MKFKKVLVLCAACIALTTFSADYADAARLGGGRSFGSAPRMTAPAPRAPSSSFMQQPSMNRQATPGAAAGAATMARPGMFGRLMGGLLAGSLLGSLLMGTGFHGGGFLDLILIGLLVFFGFRLFAGRKRTQGNYQQTYQTRNTSANTAQDAWSTLSSQPRQNTAAGADSTTSAAQAGSFDETEFLRGAKILYTRLQESWDRRDVDDIAEFSTPAVVDEIRRQLAEDPTPSHTELLLVKASLAGVEDEGIFQRAVVHFDVIMREDPAQSDSTEVQELWHFVRNTKTNESWRLDGIQQMR